MDIVKAQDIPLPQRIALELDTLRDAYLGGHIDLSRYIDRNTRLWDQVPFDQLGATCAAIDELSLRRLEKRVGL